MKRAVAAVVAVAVLAVPGIAGAAKREKVRRPGPVRVVLIGDSFTVSYQDEASALLTKRGYQVANVGAGGTGLLDAQQCLGDLARWYLASTDPDVVVMTNIGNFSGFPCVPRELYGKPEWFKAWKVSARTTQKVYLSRGSRFFWVLAPAAVRQPYATTLAKTNAIYRRVAGKRAGLIDMWGSGTYEPGIHTADGLHLNQAGQDRLARLVAAAIG